MAKFRPLVVSAAQKTRRFNPHIPLDDLVAAGMWGIVVASRTFDPKKGGSYLTSYIQYRVRDALTSCAQSYAKDRKTLHLEDLGRDYDEPFVNTLPDDSEPPDSITDRHLRARQIQTRIKALNGHVGKYGHLLAHGHLMHGIPMKDIAASLGVRGQGLFRAKKTLAGKLRKILTDLQ